MRPFISCFWKDLNYKSFFIYSLIFLMINNFFVSNIFTNIVERDIKRGACIKNLGSDSLKSLQETNSANSIKNPEMGNFKLLQKSNSYTRAMYRDFLDLNDKGILNSIVGYLGGALSVAEDVAFTVLKPVQELIKQNTPAIYENPYKNIGASVRFGEPIGLQELAFREKRFNFVKDAQEKLTGQSLSDDDVLEIGFSCSGGGWRAMCCTAGSFFGAEKIGLLQTAMYSSTLSGSTWFMGPWIYSGMSLNNYKNRLIDVANKGIGFNVKPASTNQEDAKVASAKDTEGIFDNIWVKIANSQPINIIDIYGALLSNTLLKGLAKDQHRIYISDQVKIVDNGQCPMPIYTAVLGEPDMDEFWFEFTPYEIGSRWLNAYIPTWSFGRHFKAGNSISYAPEQYLGFMMGMFGSAFAADFEDAYEFVVNSIKFPEFLKSIPFAETIFKAIKNVFSTMAYSTDFGDMRLAWARVPNFVYKIDGVDHNQHKEFQLVDAGLDMNNPVFTCYRRPPYGSAPDIIFVFDSGSDLSFNELQVLVDYAEYNGLKFPKIENFDVSKKIISVFKDDEDPEVPVIVYMPRVNGLNLVERAEYNVIDKYYLKFLEDFDIEKAVSSGFATTSNFKYEKKQAETLMAMTEFNIVYVQEEIKNILKERIELKRKFKKNNLFKNKK